MFSQPMPWPATLQSPQSAWHVTPCSVYSTASGFSCQLRRNLVCATPSPPARVIGLPFRSCGEKVRSSCAAQSGLTSLQAPSMKGLLQTSTPLLLLYLAALGVHRATASTNDTTHTGSDILSKCTGQDFCTLASQCCQVGMDDNGWIAAAVGWALWFLTLILYCVGKMKDLQPNEPKYMQA